MRNEVLPRDNWPAMTLDAKTKADIVGCLKLGGESGFNEVDIWGLFESYAYPIDIRSAFASSDRRKRVDQILSAARASGHKVIYGMGVFSWGFDKIIEHDPAVRGSNPHVMCASSPASLEWQKKLIDAIVAELGVEGFHLESADQGRCSCDKCKSMGDIEYHTKINILTGDYIHSKYPGKLAECTIQGWSAWGKNLSDADKDHLVELSKHVDVIWDQGHRRTYIEPENRGEFISRLKCDYGTSGGFWVYPPPRWNRLRWFFPYPHRTGAHMKELYAQGGRGVMFYQGPTINPGVELNIAAGGKLMLDVSREIDDVVSEALENLYRPKNPAALKKLVSVFNGPESTYFSHWDEKRIAEHDKVPAPGELHLGPLFGNSPGGPGYLDLPFLDAEGRKAYRDALLAAYDALVSCEMDLGEEDRVSRLKRCLVNACSDVETLRQGKGETT